MAPSLPRALVAEFLATATMVFAGTQAMAVDEVSKSVGHAAIGLVFGLVVASMIVVFGPISGSHMNPAVTLALAAARKFEWARVPAYVGAQALGAVAASLAVATLTPTSENLGATLPHAGVLPALVLEAFLTMVLMLTVMLCAFGPPGARPQLPFAVGAVVALEALFAGPLTGASMNPARSLGPDLVRGNIETVWVYLIGPTVGALAALPLWALLRPQTSPLTQEATP